jgi:NAD(P)H-nitrite reductase large subunit
MRYVIVGACIAGISAAKAIWSGDPGASIEIVSDEKAKPYYRPMIPFLIKKKDIDITFENGLLDKKSVTLVYDRATGIDIRTKGVTLASGKKLSYDKLLLATGSKPVVPDIPGIKGAGVFTFRKRDEAFEIRVYSTGRKKALVIGGGLIGMKAAIALKELGLEVTVVEKLPQIFLQRLDRKGASLISDIIRKSGISIATGDSVSEIIREAGNLRAARLSSGVIVDTDMVIVAVGTKPDLELLKDTGIKVNKGILINESLQTSLPGIYAAGDVVEYNDLSTGMPAVSGQWTNAEEMGRLAGRNMTGANLKYGGFLSVMNSTEFLGIPVMSIGLIEPEEKEYEIITEDNIGSYRKLVFKGDLLVGAVFVGEVANAGIYTNLIRNKIPIGGLKEEAIKGNLGYIHFLKTTPPTITV